LQKAGKSREKQAKTGAGKTETREQKQRKESENRLGN